MKKDLIELHSMKAKFMLNFYIIAIIAVIYGLTNSSIDWKNITEGTNFVLPLVIIIVLGILIGVYSSSFLGYLDKDENILILKKPFWKKKWNIKLENISYIETTTLGVVTRSKHLKIVEKKSNSEKTYYIMKGSSFFGDDENFLKNLVIKRKKEISEKK